MMKLLQGQLDELTPAQIARLEAELNASVDAAARLADVAPPRDGLVATLHETPTQHEWDAVFARIDSAVEPLSAEAESAERLKAAQRRRTNPYAVVRFWGTLLAAAACVAFALIWRLPAPPSPHDDWELRLSDHVVVERLEVFGDATTVVNFVDDQGTAVIWVIEPESPDQEQGD
ncbi:MAG: hypothetical protein D6744_13090 [Planctomycetota bacterium]|nr:MAG: hypothetical protein D6744_13090 [Planctomycetota bacterium]